jgi:hypothetical protein
MYNNSYSLVCACNACVLIPALLSIMNTSFAGVGCSSRYAMVHREPHNNVDVSLLVMVMLNKRVCPLKIIVAF